jgi:hypothetical protein
MSARNSKRSGRNGPRREQGLRPYAEFTVNAVDVGTDRVPKVAWFNGCGTMTKKERWWRCVATVYGVLASGEEVAVPIVMDSQEKALIGELIDDINEKIKTALRQENMVTFNRAECRCIIINKD